MRPLSTRCSHPFTWLLGGLLVAIGLSLTGPLPSGRITLQTWLNGHVDGDTLWIAFSQLRLPRVAATLMAGAALGMAGCLLQALSRNFLASPGVRGGTAGAQLGLIATVLLPASLALATVPTVFAGALLAVLFCFVIAGGWRAHPLTLVLAGSVVSLLLSAMVSRILVLFDQHVAGVALWSAGSLFQSGWTGVTGGLPWFMLATAMAWRNRNQLQLLALGDDSAASVGLNVDRLRRRLLLIASLLSAVAMTLAGPLGLVGLLAPNLLRLAGISQPARLLPGAGLTGALLRAFADPLADWLGDTSRSLLPLGVATAVAGTPLLLWLIGKQASAGLPVPTRFPDSRPPFPHASFLTLAILPPVALLGLQLTPDQLLDGWRNPSSLAGLLFDLRGPRVGVAMLAGTLLAASGVLLQGVVRNPLAGPELLGLSQGAALAILLSLVWFPDPAWHVRLPFSLIGVGSLLSILLWVTRKQQWAPMQLALGGMALATLCSAFGTLIVAQSKLQPAPAVTWLVGSSYGRGWAEAGLLLAGCVTLLPLAYRQARALDLLELGDETATSLGLAVSSVRLRLLGLACVLAGLVVACAGPAGFVGLVAPHMARRLGAGRHRPRLVLAMSLGAILCGLADLLGRTLLAPQDLPFGLITTLIGAPVFLCQLMYARKAT